VAVKFFLGNAPRIIVVIVIVIAPLLIFHGLTSSASLPLSPPLPPLVGACPASSRGSHLLLFLPPRIRAVLARGLFIPRSVGVFNLLHARATNPTCVARKNRERAADGRDGGKKARPREPSKRLSRSVAGAGVISSGAADLRRAGILDICALNVYDGFL